MCSKEVGLRYRLIEKTANDADHRDSHWSYNKPIPDHEYLESNEWI